METTKVNKAAQLRDKQAAEQFNAKLRRELTVFENKYLMGAVSFAFNCIKNSIKQTQKLITDFPTREPYTNRFGRDDRATLRDLEYRLQREQHYLSQDGTITLNAITQAKKSYDEKIERLVSQLIGEGFGQTKYNVETIRSVGGELEFIISNEIKTVHARFIWVEGVEVASHFRFIFTTRMNKDVAQPLVDKSVETTSVASSRGAQVAAEVANGLNAKQITEKLQMNITYVRRLMK